MFKTIGKGAIYFPTAPFDRLPISQLQQIPNPPAFYLRFSRYSSRQTPLEAISRAASFPTYL